MSARLGVYGNRKVIFKAGPTGSRTSQYQHDSGFMEIERCFLKQGPRVRRLKLFAVGVQNVVLQIYYKLVLSPALKACMRYRARSTFGAFETLFLFLYQASQCTRSCSFFEACLHFGSQTADRTFLARLGFQVLSRHLASLREGDWNQH